MVETRRQRRRFASEGLRLFFESAAVELVMEAIPKACCCRNWRAWVARRFGGEDVYKAFLTMEDAATRLGTAALVAYADRLFAALGRREATVLHRRFVELVVSERRPGMSESTPHVSGRGPPTFLCVDSRLPSPDLLQTWTRANVRHFVCKEGQSVQPCLAWFVGKPLPCHTLSAHFPSAVTVANDAFIESDQLTALTVPKASIIGNRACSGCASLKSLDLPRAADVGCDAFAHCRSLVTASLPTAMTFGHGVFKGCTTLTIINLPSAVTFGFGAFAGCTGLVSVSMARAKTVGEAAFRGCVNLTKVHLPSLVVVSKHAFKECTALPALTLPTVTYVASQAFYKCKAMTRLTLAQANLIDRDAFAGCTALHTIVLPRELLDNTRPRLRRGTKLRLI